MIKNLVFSGGGLKGYAFIGVIKALYETHIIENITKFVGTSIGSIAAYFSIIGITHNEINDFIIDFDFNSIKNINIDNLNSEYGLIDGTLLIKYINDFTKKYKNIDNLTFEELYKKTNKELIITGTCLTTKKVEYFNYNTTPNMLVLDAIRISISYPFLFTAIKRNNKIYIDGGILDNTPLSILKNENPNTVLGIKISNDTKENNGINNIEEFAINMINCLTVEIETLKINKSRQNNLLIIDIENINLFSNNFSIEDKKKLFKIGYEKTINYLKNPNLWKEELNNKQNKETQTEIYKKEDKNTQIYIN